jgi:hypothetical protein
MTVVLNWGIEGGAGFTIEAPTVKEVLAAYRGIGEIERVQHTGQEAEIRAIVRDELTVSTAGGDSPWNVKIDPEDGTYAPPMSPEGLAADGKHIVDSTPWLAWYGDERNGLPPGVEPDERVHAKLRNGEYEIARAHSFTWRHNGGSGDIVAFRKV